MVIRSSWFEVSQYISLAIHGINLALIILLGSESDQLHCVGHNISCSEAFSLKIYIFSLFETIKSFLLCNFIHIC